MSESSEVKSAGAQAQITRIIRISGAVMVLAGIVAFFDIGGLATLLGMGTNNLHQILGGTLLIAGVIEIVVLPRLLEKK